MKKRFSKGFTQSLLLGIKNSKERIFPGVTGTKRGFTLIELLVVISIIALLSSVVLATLTEARAKARNAKRHADINNLIKTFAIGLNDKGYLPTPQSQNSNYCISEICSLSGTTTTLWTDSTINSYLSEYINPPLKDPTNSKLGISRGYRYIDRTTDRDITYSSTTMKAGKQLIWFEEAPLDSNSCAPGYVGGNDGSAITCLYRLDE